MADIGSISSGTMRPEDLLPAFSTELERLDELGAYSDLCQEADDYDYSDEADDGILSDLFDALDHFAPPYCYFGAHEGDGSAYGFWPSSDAIDDAVHSGELLKLEAGDELPANVQLGQAVMFVTDHGNVTIGHVGPCFVEDWSCV